MGIPPLCLAMRSYCPHPAPNALYASLSFTKHSTITRHFTVN